jgi:hypothetical protein
MKVEDDGSTIAQRPSFSPSGTAAFEVIVVHGPERHRQAPLSAAPVADLSRA